MSNKLTEELVNDFLKWKEEISEKFEYEYKITTNKLGVSETRFWVKGICPICNEKMVASVLIPKISDDYDKTQKLRAVCDKCNKEFGIDFS